MNPGINIAVDGEILACMQRKAEARSCTLSLKEINRRTSEWSRRHGAVGLSDALTRHNGGRNRALLLWRKHRAGRLANANLDAIRRDHGKWWVQFDADPAAFH